ncbi:hypothetical protein ES702_02192 [subsurface metagenome]
MTFVRPELELKLRAPLAGGQPGTHEFRRATSAVVGNSDTCDFITDGVADDVEIVAALTYVNGLGGGEVRLLEAPYTLADPIAFPGNNLILTGLGRNSFIDGDGLATGEHAIVLSGVTDCIVRDLAIQTEDGGGKVCHCIFIEDGANNFHIGHVTIVDSDSDGIHVEGTSILYGHIHLCHIEDADDYGIQVNMDGGNFIYRLHIIDCDITGAGNAGLAFQTSAGNWYCLIEGNDLEANGAQGILVIDSDYTIINNNICFGNGGDGIEVNSTDHVMLNNNICQSNVEHGIYLVGSNECTLEGNICDLNDSGDTGNFDGVHLDADSHNSILLGTHCGLNHGQGIHVYSDDNILLANYLFTNDLYGITIAADALRNYVEHNYYNGNLTGAINDLGTDTRLQEVVENVSDSDSFIGDHPSAVLLNGVINNVRFEFRVPSDFQELVRAYVILVPEDGGALRRDIDTDYGHFCTEAYNATSEHPGYATVAGLTLNQLECIDVSGALATIAASDDVGLTFMRDATHGEDTIEASVQVLKFVMQYV